MMQKWFKYGLILVFVAGVANAESVATNKTVKAATGARSFVATGKKLEKNLKPAELTSYNSVSNEKELTEKQDKKANLQKKPLMDRLEVSGEEIKAPVSIHPDF
jgi:hypothetical protein